MNRLQWTLRALLIGSTASLVVGIAQWRNFQVKAQSPDNFRITDTREQVALPSPCSGQTPCWLTKKLAILIDPSRRGADDAESLKYYQTIGASLVPTLKDFQIRNGFIQPNGQPLNVGPKAFYFNNGDLKLGREMHCNQQGSRIACYVSNYGPAPFDVKQNQKNPDFPNAVQALREVEDVASNGASTFQPFATVAMEYLPEAPLSKTVAVREADGATAYPALSKNCLANYSGNIPPTGSDVDTGLDIEPGDSIVFSATGFIWSGYCFFGRNSPDGMSWSVDDLNFDFPLPGKHEDALIGAVGSPGQAHSYFEIGSQATVPYTGRPGRLFVRTNDNMPGNGSGSFDVTITIHRNQRVKFYVYGPGPAGVLTPHAALDREGNKSVPQMCMACHGGDYDPGTHEAKGASFLPFDIFSFLYSQRSGLHRDDQEEQLRQLNLLVKLTDPNPMNNNAPIQTMIDVLYDNKVNVPGTKAVSNAVPGSNAVVPSDWETKPRLYQSFIGPYCRTCHVALRPSLDFSSYRGFTTALGFANAELNIDVCQNGRMPHAQVPYEALAAAKIDSEAAKDLHVLGFSCLVVPERFTRPPRP